MTAAARGVVHSAHAHYAHGLIEHVPDGERRDSITPPTPRLVLSRGGGVNRAGDETTLLHLLPVMIDIVQHHIDGGGSASVDPADGLLRQGAQGISSRGWMQRWVRRAGANPWRQRAVVQRVAVGVGSRKLTRRPTSKLAPSCYISRSMSVFGMPGMNDGDPAGRASAGRPALAISTIRCWTRRAGSR